MAKLFVRPGTLDNLKESRGIATDEAMARVIGCSPETYGRVKRGDQSPSPDFIANLGNSFTIEPFLFFQIVSNENEKASA